MKLALAQITKVLVEVIQELSRATNFAVQSLSESEVRSIFTLDLSNPGVSSTILLNAPQQRLRSPALSG